jgi:hypothetical protein
MDMPHFGITMLRMMWHNLGGSVYLFESEEDAKS